MRHRKVSAALAIVMSVWMWLPAAPECGAQVFLFEWGQAGAGDGQFNEPSGIAIDSAGNVYVADTANHRIQKFDDQGNFLLKWGSSGSGAGQFDAPKGVAVDSADNVYVVDSGNHRIQKFGASAASSRPGAHREAVPGSSASPSELPSIPWTTSTSPTPATTGSRSSTATESSWRAGGPPGMGPGSSGHRGRSQF